MPRYEVVDYLIEKGFEATIAEQISEELGVELVEDLHLIREENILKLNFLTPEDKDTLWHLVTASFEKLSLSEKEEVYKNRQQLHSGAGGGAPSRPRSRDSRERRGLGNDAKMSNVSDLLLRMKTMYSQS